MILLTISVGTAQEAQVCSDLEILGSQNKLHPGCHQTGEVMLNSIRRMHQCCSSPQVTTVQASDIAEIATLLQNQRQDFVQPGAALCYSCRNLLDHWAACHQ